MHYYIGPRETVPEARREASALRRQPTARAYPLGAGEREALYRLRYKAYRHDGMIVTDPGHRVADEFDEMPNAILLGLHIDGTLASSIRLNIAAPSSADCPASRVFPEIVQPWIEAGRTIVDPTRFVLDPASARNYPRLAYATMRLAWLACTFFDADILLATPRIDAGPFYSRVFGHHMAAEPRPYPALGKPLGLMVLDFRQKRARVLKRFPFFASTPQEREALFGRQFPLPKERYPSSPSRRCAEMHRPSAEPHVVP